MAENVVAIMLALLEVGLVAIFAYYNTIIRRYTSRYPSILLLTIFIGIFVVTAIPITQMEISHLMTPERHHGNPFVVNLILAQQVAAVAALLGVLWLRRG